MAIRNRRGNNTDFDPNKLLAGEFAYILDKKELHYCYAPGFVKKLVTSDDVNEILNSSETAYAALQKLLSDLEGNPSQVTNILNNIVSLQNNKLDKTGDGKDNIETFSIAAEETDIVSGEKHSVIFGKILKSINTFRTNITNIITNIGTLTSLLTTDKTNLVKAINELVNGKINKANIVQNAISTNPDTVASGPALKAVNERVNETNNNLVSQNVSYSAASGVTVSEISLKCKNNRVTVQIGALLSTSIGTTEKTVLTISNFIPAQNIRFIVHTGDFLYNAINPGYGILDTGGNIKIKSNNTTDKAFVINLSYDV